MSLTTIVLSDTHLADAEPPHPKRPLWKAYKRVEHFIDDDFAALLDHFLTTVDGPIELVLNGDIFDFDSVMTRPKGSELHLTWLEKNRGLSAEEPKSRYKVRKILDDHPAWVAALKKFVLAGHKLVFIAGNHDMELHWPGVQADVRERLDLPGEAQARVIFCEWFYISDGDTLIEHGNQYDVYCVCQNPINPLIRKGQHATVRLPFGNLAARYMINGMGLLNPHVDSSFIKSSFGDYVRFWYRHMMRTQPLLFFTWFWSAMVTLLASIREGFLPAMTDPLTLPKRVEGIAERAQANQSMLWSLRELHAHPAIFNPLQILRELWLDRVLLLGAIVFGSFQLITAVNVVYRVRFWWVLVPIVLFFPLLIRYGRSVVSDLDRVQRAILHATPLSAHIARVKRVIHGHTHKAAHLQLEGVEYLNTGTWSPAYHDVACTQPYGQKCFVWIRPELGSRHAELFEWVRGSDSASAMIRPVGVGVANVGAKVSGGEGEPVRVPLADEQAK